VRGKGVDLHWGQIKVTDNSKAIWEWETTNKEQLIGGESIETKQFHLDMFSGLEPGTFWYITGEDVRFVGENFQ
jgi:hypothetical protein